MFYDDHYDSEPLLVEQTIKKKYRKVRSDPVRQQRVFKNMSLHRLTKLKERTRCDCGRSFSYRERLAYHHDRECRTLFECNRCPKKYTELSLMESHSRDVHGASPFCEDFYRIATIKPAPWKKIKKAEMKEK